MLGQVPMAAARDGAMPAVFARVSSRGVPAQGLVISVGLATLLVLIEISGTGAGVSFYNLVVSLSTDAAMIPYVFCSVVEAILFVTRKPLSRALRIGPYMPIGLVAFVFSMGTIYGAGAHAGMWALILILLAAPVWVFLVEDGSTDSEEMQR
jgi:amino acid transporter